MKNESTFFAGKPATFLRRHQCFLQLVFVLILAASSSTLLCQSRMLSFDDAGLGEVIRAIEGKSDYVFNYDPNLLEGYHFSGEVDAGKVTDALKDLLYDSPYTYALDGNTVLVFRPEPKTYRVCGTVGGFANEPLIAANIAAVQTNLGGQSDELGFFDFELTADKNQKIQISYLGYHPVSFMVQDLVKDGCPVYRLSIDQELWTGEIVVRDYLLDGISEGKAFGGFGLDFDQLSKNHSNVEHDILKTAQLLPGINSIDDSATNLQIRGSSPGQNMILWEGAPVYNAGHVFGMISAINPFSVSGVNIYKGAHDPKYDNRVGGIVDISLTDSIGNAFHGSLGTTLTEVHANLEVPIIDDRLALVLSGRQSIRGVYDSPTLQSYTDKVFQFSLIDDQASGHGSLNSEQLLNYNDWNAKLLYQASDRLRASFGVYNNQQDFEYSFSFDDDPFLSVDKIAVNTRIINSEIELELSEKWSGLFSFYSSLYNNRYNAKESENEVLLRNYSQFNVIQDNSLTLSNSYKPSPNWVFNAGYEYNTKSVGFDLGDDVNFDPDFLAERNERAGFHNVFLSANHSGKKTRIDAGVRTTYYQERNTWTHSPRLSLQYFINEKLKVKIDGGVYHQFISQVRNFGSRQISVDNPLWILNASDSQLSQVAKKIAAGFVFRDRGWLVDIDAYYNHTDGLSTLTPLFGLVSGSSPFSKGSSTVLGLDVLLKKKWSRFNTWINYSFGVNKNNFPELFDEDFFSPNDIRHNVSVVSSFKVKGLQFSLSSNYHSGLPFSSPEVVFNEDDEQAVDPFLYFLDYQQFNENRLKPYIRFDLNVNYRFDLGRKEKLEAEISLSFINIFNAKNIASREYDLVYDEEDDTYTLAYINKALLGRTPLLLLRVYW